MSETLATVQAEMQAAYKQIKAIDDRYENGLITDAQDAAEVQRLETATVELAAKANALQVADARRQRTDTALATLSTPAERHLHPETPRDAADEYARKSLGDIFIDDERYRQLRDSGVFNSPNSQFELQVSAGQKTSIYQRIMAKRQAKALVYAGDAAGGGAFPTPQYLPGVIDALQRPLTLLDLIPTTQTNSDTISYIQEDARTNNAALVAEASATTGTSGLKPESALAFSRQTESIKTAATWVPITNRMLADTPAIRGIIDNRLMVMLEQTLETQILTGDDTGENFKGILASGIQTRGKGSDANEAALYKAAVQVAVTGEIAPDTIVLNPLNWQTIRLAVTTGSGEYTMGAPSMVGADTLWGYRVVLSQAMPSGTGLVGSFRLGGMYFEREGAMIRTGYIDDQFVRNMSTLLVEARGAWITFRPTAYARVTGLT